MNEKQDSYEALKLKNQLCFPLYVCSKEIVRGYTPYLKPVGLTYTQYITMMVLWEEKRITVGELGHRLYLDSGTLTPLLRKLERTRSGDPCYGGGNGPPGTGEGHPAPSGKKHYVWSRSDG